MAFTAFTVGSQVVTGTVAAIDVVGSLGYSTTCIVRISNLPGGGEIHEIWDTGAPTVNGFANAPNGSLYHDTTAGVYHSWAKDGQPGSGIGGTWRAAS